MAVNIFSDRIVSWSKHGLLAKLSPTGNEIFISSPPLPNQLALTVTLFIPLYTSEHVTTVSFAPSGIKLLVVSSRRLFVYQVRDTQCLNDWQQAYEWTITNDNVSVRAVEWLSKAREVLSFI